MLKTTICFLLGMCTLLAAQAQQESSMKERMIEHLKKEKFRTPVPVEDAIASFEARYFDKKTRSSQELKVSNSSSPAVEEGEAHIAMDPNNNNRMVLSYMDNSTTGLSFPVYYSNNGGQNWNLSNFNALTYLLQDFGAGTLVAGGGDPIFAYDKNGKLWFSWIYLAFSQAIPDTAYACMYLASSTDNGTTWNVASGADRYIGRCALNVLTFEPYPNSEGFYDRQWFAMDYSNGSNANSLYCSFIYFPSSLEPASLVGTTIKKKAGASNGFAPARFQVVSGETQFGNLVVDKNGNLHVTYSDLNSNTIYHKVSTDGGITYSSAHQIYNGTNLFGAQGNGYIHDRENGTPNLSIDGDDILHLVWSDFPVSAGPDFNSYYARSTDGGNTWSTPLLLTHNGNKFLMPVVSCHSKKVTIGSYVIDANKVSDYYFMTSTNNGANFGAPQKISTQTTNFGAMSNTGKWFGDYFNSVRNDSKIYNIWSDGRGSSGPKMYVSVTNEWPNAITEISPLNAGIELTAVYPVPANRTLTLSFKSIQAEELDIQLINLDGKLIMNQKISIEKGSSKSDLNLPDLAKGNYMLEIQTKEGIRFSRLITK